MNRREVATSSGGRLQTREVRLDHLRVTVDREDEGDVDAASPGDHRRDGIDALDRRRDLDEQVRSVDPLMQILCRPDRPVDVVGQLGGDLDRDEPVATPAGVVDRSQHAERADDIVDDDIPIGVDQLTAGTEQIGELSVVGIRALDRLGEDGRVGGHTANPLAHHASEGAIAQVIPREVVQPWALPVPVVELLKSSHVWLPTS